MDFRAVHDPPRRIRRGALTFAALAAALLAAPAAAGAACGSPDGAVAIADVDARLDLVLTDGRVVRLGGLAALDPARAPEAAAAERAFLVARVVGQEGELLRLASGLDRWGRVVADVALPDAAAGGGRETVVSLLLAAGYARVAPAFETRACADARLSIEDAARRAGLGLWADPRFSAVGAADLETLRRSGGRFVIVEGAVHRVGFGRSRLYLDLAPRGAPTIVLPRKLEPAFARAGHTLGALAGQAIRVRGALDNRVGPRLEVSEPAMIEFLGRWDGPVAGGPRP